MTGANTKISPRISGPLRKALRVSVYPKGFLFVQDVRKGGQTGELLLTEAVNLAQNRDELP